MTMSVKVSGAWKPVTALSIKVGGVWKPVTSGKVRVSGVWKEFFAPAAGVGGGGMTVSLSPTTLSKSKTGPAYSSTVNSGAYAGTVTVTGATGAYTYRWTRYSAAASSPFVGYGLTGVTPYWTASVYEGDTLVEVWRLTVTDSAGHTATANLTVSLSFTTTATSGGGIIP